LDAFLPNLLHARVNVFVCVVGFVRCSQVVDRHVGAVLCEPDGDGLTDPGGPAGDQDVLPLDAAHTLSRLHLRDCHRILLRISGMVMSCRSPLTRRALHGRPCNAKGECATEPEMEVHFTNLLIVVAAAFAAPLALGLVPALKLPSVVLEILAGIVLGPSILGWVKVDQAVEVLATIGLAFLLFLAGLEIEFHKLRGRPLALASAGYASSFGLALVMSLVLDAAGLAQSALLVAIILTATSLGIV